MLEKLATTTTLARFARGRRYSVADRSWNQTGAGSQPSGSVTRIADGHGRRCERRREGPAPSNIAVRTAMRLKRRI